MKVVISGYVEKEPQPYELLEKELAEWAGQDDMVVCSSGSAALHLALEALELPLGSKILVPEFTMIACARSVVLAGHVPVFVDCGDDLLLDHHKVTEVINHVGAIMAVHIYGRRSDMNWLTSLGKPVIEDLAEAHGVTPHPKSAAACWSFYRNKIVAGEEGGAVCFPRVNSGLLSWSNPLYPEIARELRCQGFSYEHDFIHRPRGCNYRLSNANAEIIRESLLPQQVKSELQWRRDLETQYNDLLNQFCQRPYRDAPWVYDLFHPRAHELVTILNEQGIQARRAFAPMSMQPEFAAPYTHLKAYTAYGSTLYLPLDPGTPAKEMELAAATINGLAP
jgi:dTDP-4-amino-4,6-dideoxygalactose transaminase